MFQKILVPLDGSTAGRNALDQAMQLARDNESVITALCVIDVRVSHEARIYLPGENEISVSNEGVSPAKAAAIYQGWAEQVIAAAQAHGATAGVQVQTEIVSGIPYHEIISRSSRHDLLVIGPRQTSSAYPGPFLAGATLWYVAAHTHLPTLCVFAPPQKLDTILVAYDDSRAARDALQLAATLCQIWESTLIVITVQPEGRQAQHILRQARLRASPIVPRLVARDGDPKRAILNIVARYNCNLIVLGVHAHHSLLRYSLG